MNAEAAIAEAGHNNPPEQTPFELVAGRINDLYTEAKNWLDGEPVTTGRVSAASSTSRWRRALGEVTKYYAG